MLHRVLKISVLMANEMFVDHWWTASNEVNNRLLTMRYIDIFLLIAYAVCLSVGQVLFKFSSQSLAGGSSSINDVIMRLAASPSFWSAIIIYGALTVLWVWILSRVTLVAAYPFVALCFVLVPVMSRLAFGERIGAGYIMGTGLIMAGLGLIFLEVGK